MTVSRFYLEMVPSHWPQEQREFAIKEFKARERKRKTAATRRANVLAENAKAAKGCMDIRKFLNPLIEAIVTEEPEVIEYVAEHCRLINGHIVVEEVDL